jgi:hypothetical protein
MVTLSTTCGAKPMTGAIAAALFALLAAISPAEAQTSCTWVGNYYVCNGPGGRTTSCTQVGNYWTCN